MSPDPEPVGERLARLEARVDDLYRLVSWFGGLSVTLLGAGLVAFVSLRG